jgi:hypothetical protein
MRSKSILAGIIFTFILAAAVYGANPEAKKGPQKWAPHDPNRPLPKVVTPGKESKAPSDAVVLFDGRRLSEWVSAKGGGPAKWKVEKGYMEVVPKSGSIQTKRSFGSCQLHIEWMAPRGGTKDGQKRGNSGVFLMGRYEVQVLDCYNNTTYADGYAGALYGQYPPLVNVCLPPGQWQSFDIIFHRPVFEKGRAVIPATATVFHNGVLVQDHVVVKGKTVHKKEAQYEPHEDKLPLTLQDHKDPVRFRNIWIRPIPEPDLSPQQLQLLFLMNQLQHR